jgi:hypothetical protein
MDIDKLLALKERYRVDGSHDAHVWQAPACKCGNLLTINDSGYTCRQCVLAGRLK